jgi:hypothetical protein
LDSERTIHSFYRTPVEDRNIIVALVVEESRKQTNAIQAAARAIMEGNGSLRAMESFMRTGSKIGSYLAEDAALNITRVSG